MKHSIIQAALMVCLVCASCSSPFQHYYIVPIDSVHSQCSNHGYRICLTLEQLAHEQSEAMSAGGVNLTLAFLPGEHVLTRTLSIQNFEHVQMNGIRNESSDSLVVVSFHTRNRIEISNSDDLSIDNISFVHRLSDDSPSQYFWNQQGLSVNTVQTVHISSCSFVGIDNHIQSTHSAIHISRALNTTVYDSTFKGNFGTVLYIESHDTILMSSKFRDNVDSTVQISSTNTVISDSQFLNNTGGMLTIHPKNSSSVQTRNSRHCKLVNSTSSTDAPVEFIVRTNEVTVCGGSEAVHVSVSNVSLLCTQLNGCFRPTAMDLKNISCYIVRDMISNIEYNQEVISPVQSETIGSTNCHFNSCNESTPPTNFNIALFDSKNRLITLHYDSVSLGKEGRICINSSYQHSKSNTSTTCLENSFSVCCMALDTDSARCYSKASFTQLQFKTDTDSNDDMEDPSLAPKQVVENPGTVLISSCTFANNKDGAVSIHTSRRYHVSTILITSCNFTNNTNNGAGGALSINSGSESYINCSIENLLITSCTFTNNTSTRRSGGALSIYSGLKSAYSSIENLLLTSCTFTDSISYDGSGGAISIFSGFEDYQHNSIRNLLLTSCTFTNSTSAAEGGGGALSVYSGSGIYIYNRIENLLITSCTFTNSISYAGSGGALAIFSGFGNHKSSSIGSLLFTSCAFTHSTSYAGSGGALAIFSGFGSYESTSIRSLLFTSCTFTNNTSDGGGGGAFSINSGYGSYIHNSIETILITSCTFTHNAIGYHTIRNGGAFCIFSGLGRYQSNSIRNLLLTSSTFTNNTSARGNGGAFSVYSDSGFQNSINCYNRLENLLITSCTFTNNVSPFQSGGAFSVISNVGGKTSSRITNLQIISCTFTNNTSEYSGGAVSLVTELGNLLIASSTFTSNACRRYGGAFYFEDLVPCFSTVYEHQKGAVVSISDTRFDSNTASSGGALYATSDIESHLKISVVKSHFTSTSVKGISLRGLLIAFNSSNFTQNEHSILYLQQTIATFLRDNIFRNNIGSIFTFDSRVEFRGPALFTGNHYSAPIHSVQSQIYFSSQERIKIINNTAAYGGGIYLRESTMTVLYPIKISQNTADYGGGIYSFLSTIDFTSDGESKKYSSISKNIANQNGGGVCAIATTIKISRSFVWVAKNVALFNGGGMYLEQNSNVYLLKKEQESVFSPSNVKLVLKNNSAEYGGGIFVADKTASRSMCSGEANSDSQCFLQTINLYEINPAYGFKNYVNTLITSNKATKSGGAIFGGLFDRCEINPLSEAKSLSWYRAEYINTTISYDSSISSDPVRVVFCYQPTLHDVRKGDSFRVHVKAIDQMEKPVSATIHGSVITESGIGHLKEGQAKQSVGDRCTELEYNVFSQDSSARLELYAEGPCTNLGISKQVFDITFSPCTCPVGLSVSQSPTVCECVCDPELEAHQITNCSQKAGTIQLETDIWVGVANSTNETEYVIHGCPFDYCVEKPVNISLSSSEEIDRQCAFNRTGLLCGECREGLSLVLATSRCEECSNLYLLLLIPFALAGVLLVGFILVCNITIATGTIQGLIFYANVLAANKAIFLPFTTPNFLTVFISWVNLDLGIETCFYNEMNSQAKLLLQVVFPAYLFLLMFLIIVLSKYFHYFSKLLSHRNPVAALCTLVLLSYSKLIRFIIAALQYAVLDFPDNSQRTVWLFDANIEYFTPSHTPRLVAAALILVAGGVLAVMLFFAQWFPLCSNWRLMKWTRNPRYTGFMDAYHAPYTSKHRYWVGLLLFALIIHNVVAAMATDTFLPVLSAGSLSVGLISLKLLGNKVYQTWYTNSLETLFLFNLAIFANGIFYTRYLRFGQKVLATVSTAIAFILFLIIICFHCHKYILMKTRIWPKLSNLFKVARPTGSRHRQPNCYLDMHRAEPSYAQMENNELLETLDYNDEGLQDLPYANERELHSNQYHTPPNIVPASRPGQLRASYMDDLAPPITTDDYRLAPPPSRPQVTNRPEVTCTTIDPVIEEIPSFDSDTLNW